MAAQALCEPALTMLPNQLPISSPGFGGYFKYQISGICAINYLAPIRGGKNLRFEFERIRFLKLLRKPSFEPRFYQYICIS
jgi:hypothetical protein